MLSKKICRCILLTITVFVLTACGKLDLNLYVYEDATSKCLGNIYIENQTFDALFSDLDEFEIILNRVGIDLDLGSWQKTEATIDGVHYSGYSFQIPTDDFLYAIKDEDNHIILQIDTSSIDDYAIDFDLINQSDDMSFFESLNFQATMKIAMPGKVISSTAGEVDGNNVIINLMQEYEEIVVESKIDKHLEDYLGIIALVGIVFVFITYIILNKLLNKKVYTIDELILQMKKIK